MSQPCSRGTSATIMRRPSCRCSRRWNSIFWRERCTRAGGLRAAIAAARRPASHVCACRRRVAGGIMIVAPAVVTHVFLSCSHDDEKNKKGAARCSREGDRQERDRGRVEHLPAEGRHGGA